MPVPPALHPFAGATLLVTPRSPFARRVRVAFREAGLPHEERVVDVFHPDEALLRANPLGRVPALVLTSGHALVEAQLILDRFWAALEPAPWWPTDPAARLVADRTSGLAQGLCELAVTLLLEGQRDPAQQDAALVAEARAGVARALVEAERLLCAAPHGPAPSAGAAAWLTGEAPGACDFDLGVALTYLSFRVSPAWRGDHPRLAEFVDVLEARPTFAATRPVA